MLREVLKDEWGFDGVVDVRLVRRPVDRAGRQRRRSTWSCRARRPVGRRAGRGGPRRPGHRGGGRRQGAAAAAARRPRRRPGRRRAARADRRTRGRRDAVAAELRGARRRRVRAGCATPRSRRACAAAGPRGAAPGGGARPQRRGRADPRRRQRHGLPALHRLAAGGPARRPRPDVEVDHGRGVRSTDRLPVAPTAAAPPSRRRRPGVEVRFLAADGTVLGTEDRTGGAFNWLGRFGPDLPIDRGRRRRGPHPPARPRGRRPTWSAAPALGPLRLDGGRPVAFDDRHRAATGADPVEGMMRPPQRRRAGRRSTPARRSRSCSATGPDPAASATPSSASSTFQLNVATAGLGRGGARRRRWRWPPRPTSAVVVVGTTEEVESEGFDRDSLALPGRQDELVGGSPRPTRARSWWSTPARRCCCPGPTRSRPCCWPGSRARSSATRWPTCSSATPSRAGGCRRPGRRPSTAASRRPGRSTAQLAYDEGLHIGYRAYDRAGTRPAFPFGHGLGYTTWEYLSHRRRRAGRRRRRRRSPSGCATPGARPGRRSCRSTPRRPDSAVERPARWLAGFAAVTAGPGQRSPSTCRPGPQPRPLGRRVPCLDRRAGQLRPRRRPVLQRPTPRHCDHGGSDNAEPEMRLSILRSREQPADMLCDDDAEPLVIRGVEVDAVGRRST